MNDNVNNRRDVVEASTTSRDRSLSGNGLRGNVWQLLFRSPPLSRSDLITELQKYREGGDTTARDRIMYANTGLVYKVARRYVGHGVALDDLIQAGYMGVWKAIDRFDPERATTFSTYAVVWIRHHVQREIQNTPGKYPYRIPVHRLDAYRRVRRSTARLEARLGRVPTDEELIADDPRLNSAIIKGCRMDGQSVASLDTPIRFEGDDATSGWKSLGNLETHSDPDPEQAFDQEEQSAKAHSFKMLLAEAMLLSLPTREARIIELRYGLDGAEPRTLQRIGPELNVAQPLTRERIRQLVQKAQQRLIRYFRLRHPTLPSFSLKQMDEMLTAMGEMVQDAVERTAEEQQPVYEPIDPNAILARKAAKSFSPRRVEMPKRLVSIDTTGREQGSLLPTRRSARGHPSSRETSGVQTADPNEAYGLLVDRAVIVQGRRIFRGAVTFLRIRLRISRMLARRLLEDMAQTGRIQRSESGWNCIELPERKEGPMMKAVSEQKEPSAPSQGHDGAGAPSQVQLSKLLVQVRSLESKVEALQNELAAMKQVHGAAAPKAVTAPAKEPLPSTPVPPAEGHPKKRRVQMVPSNVHSFKRQGRQWLSKQGVQERLMHIARRVGVKAAPTADEWLQTHASRLRTRQLRDEQERIRPFYLLMDIEKTLVDLASATLR